MIETFDIHEYWKVLNHWKWIKDCEIYEDLLWDLWMIEIFVIEKLHKEKYWYSWIIIILKSIESLKMNKGLWKLVRFMVKTFDIHE